jgi:hypothetical protein
MFKIFNLWRQKPAKHQATPDGYLPYFEDDSFPLKWHETISNSPSANACVSTIADFLEGFGFSDTELESKVVNARGETLFQIHQKTAASFAEFEGFYWHFMYDGSGKIVEWYALPFECCRLGVPDDNGWISRIYYNPFFGTPEYRAGRKNKDTTKFHVYNPAGLKEQILNEGEGYHGQVLFVGTTTAQSRFYPYPEAKSAEKWMKIEARVADYHDDKLENGLHQDYIQVMKGDANAPSTNPEYSSGKTPKTVSQEFEEVMTRNFTGAKKAGTVMVQWVNVAAGEEVPEIIPIPSEASGDLFINLDNQATKKITVAFKVPAILANINEGVSLGGDGNMLRVAVKLMQQRVIKKQRILTDNYTKVLRDFAKPYTEPITIVPYNPYPELEVIDDKIWNALTTDEQRKWIQENTEIALEIEETVETPEPLTPEAKFKNAIPVGFPESVRNTVKKALEAEEKRAMKCSTRGGREVADQIMNNQSMSLRQVKRVYSYLKKRPELENSTWDKCDVILYNQWGGKEMEMFLESKINDINAWLN